MLILGLLPRQLCLAVHLRGLIDSYKASGPSILGIGKPRCPSQIPRLKQLPRGKTCYFINNNTPCGSIWSHNSGPPSASGLATLLAWWIIPRDWDVMWALAGGTRRRQV
jgi:hypothetical protein